MPGKSTATHISTFVERISGRSLLLEGGSGSHHLALHVGHVPHLASTVLCTQEAQGLPVEVLHHCTLYVRMSVCVHQGGTCLHVTSVFACDRCMYTREVCMCTCEVCVHVIGVC